MTHTEAISSLASERYLLDEMSDQEREAFEAHYFECPDCADDVTIGARLQDGVRAGLLQSPVARVATFTPAANPGFTPVSITVTLGNARAAVRALSSRESLSTRTVSTVLRPVHRRTDSRQASV